MKIGITGATGQLGRMVIEKLKEKNLSNSIVALVRSPQKANNFGVETREFDYEKPEGHVKALTGIENLLLISGNEIGKRFIQHSNVIAAAREAKVSWIVYTSILRADTSTISLAGEHLATENAIRNSGIHFTILRNGWYTENYTGSIGGALSAGAFIGCAGEGKISSAGRKDYADAAAAVLTGNGNRGRIFELAGDNAFTLTELAAEISRQTGMNIPYNNLSVNDYAGILKNLGVPEGFAMAIAGWDISASKGDLFDDSGVLSKLTGHPTTPLSVSVAEALKSNKK